MAAAGSGGGDYREYHGRRLRDSPPRREAAAAFRAAPGHGGVDAAARGQQAASVGRAFTARRAPGLKAPAYAPFRTLSGSNRAARLAGTTHAIAVTASSTSGTTMKVRVSCGVTPYSNVAIDRASATAAMTPAAIPQTPIVSPCRTTRRTICDGRAPSALRTAISRERCATAYDSTPNNPTAAMTSAKHANPPRRIV